MPNRKTLFSWFKPSWYKPTGHSFELLSVVTLTSVLALLQMEDVEKGLWVAGAVTLAAILFVAAVLMARQAAIETEKEKRIAGEKLHVVSESRLKVLAEDGAPADVIFCLTKLISLETEEADYRLQVRKHKTYPEIRLTANQLLSKMRDDLGYERTEAVKDIVLKHTPSYSPVEDSVAPEDIGVDESNIVPQTTVKSELAVQQ